MEDSKATNSFNEWPGELSTSNMYSGVLEKLKRKAENIIVTNMTCLGNANVISVEISCALERVLCGYQKECGKCDPIYASLLGFQEAISMILHKSLLKKLSCLGKREGPLMN